MHHINESGLHINIGNNSFSKLYFYNYFLLTESNLLFKSEVQEYTNINILLKEGVHILECISMANYRCQCVVECHKSGNFFTDSQKNWVR